MTGGPGAGGGGLEAAWFGAAFTFLIFYKLLPAGRARSACPAGTKIALRSRVCVCVCVCSSAIITCAKLRHSVTMPL